MDDQAISLSKPRATDSPPPQSSIAPIVIDEAARQLGETGDGSVTISAADLERLRLDAAHRSGSGWFFWIAGFSMVNSIAIALGFTWSFLVGLAATQIVSAIGHQFGPFGDVAGLVFDLAIAAVIVLVGVFARKRLIAAYVAGMVFYTVDGLLLLPFGDFLPAAFHLFALWGIWNGMRAALKLNRMEPPVVS